MLYGFRLILANLILLSFLSATVLGGSATLPLIGITSIVALVSGITHLMEEFDNSKDPKPLLSADPRWLIDAKQQFINEEINQLEFERLLDDGFAGKLNHQVTTGMLAGIKPGDVQPASRHPFDLLDQIGAAYVIPNILMDGQLKPSGDKIGTSGGWA